MSQAKRRIEFGVLNFRLGPTSSDQDGFSEVRQFRNAEDTFFVIDTFNVTPTNTGQIEGYLGLMFLCADTCFQGIRLMGVRIPMHTVRDHSARLECHFDMEGESLYSVKWYKDGNEFYRYLPRDMPPAQVFPLPGVTIDADSSFLRGPFNASDREGLETSTLGLEFKVRPKHFRRGGDMKLKCLATIATVYWRSNEESVEGDRPHKAPALETRKWTQGDAEASSSGEFGADRSGGAETCFSGACCLDHLLLLLVAVCSTFISPTPCVHLLDR